ncbi:MAG: hypothetical protein GF368_04065 [Candidatus Aenigmarchaeota archaeon]|nr:hypothetical protein [Candidatus Aenigmarchaeota archaeon]
MSPKAISTHTIFLIGAITLFLLFTIISLWNWLHLVDVDATEASCTAKLLNYCERWKLRGEDPGDWGEIEPIGCQEFDITKPSAIDDCKMI